MILPARHGSPPNNLTPRRCPGESRPLREDPPAFLCAMVISVLFRHWFEFMTTSRPRSPPCGGEGRGCHSGACLGCSGGGQIGNRGIGGGRIGGGIGFRHRRSLRPSRRPPRRLAAPGPELGDPRLGG